MTERCIKCNAFAPSYLCILSGDYTCDYCIKIELERNAFPSKMLALLNIIIMESDKSQEQLKEFQKQLKESQEQLKESQEQLKESQEQLKESQ